MISLTPSLPVSAADTSAVFALLQLVSDPAACKQRLDDLIAQTHSAQEASDKARQDTSEAAAALAQLEEMDRDVSERLAGVKCREDALAEREASVSARETEADAGVERAREAAKLMETATKMKAEYDSKLNRLKALT